MLCLRKRTISLLKLFIFLLIAFGGVVWLKNYKKTDPALNINPVGLGKLKDTPNEIPEMGNLEAPSFQSEDKPLLPKPHKKGQVNKYDLEFLVDESHFIPGLGEDGKPVRLFGKELEEAEAVMKKSAFNLIVSDKISYNRSLPDVRDPRCKAEIYSANLPLASVIIIFTNEAWSPLIRTIWSVINRSPAKYLKEIILVDDFSDHVELKGKLEQYIKTKLASFSVRLVRLKERQGLIRARIAGAREAIGDVIIFLDSHCEVFHYNLILAGQLVPYVCCIYMLYVNAQQATVGWLEPLLHRIKQDKHAVLVPIIDVIDDKTLEYNHGDPTSFQIGSFTWSGHFTWMDVPKREIIRRGNPVGPTYSPTMAGGLFAMDKQYFWDLGKLNLARLLIIIHEDVII